MAGVKETKNRIRSMKSTRQITKAMEMVASSKLRKAQARVLTARPYFEALEAAIGQITAADGQITSPYLQKQPAQTRAVVVIAGDRGLAGGYNSNLLRQAACGPEDKVLPIGRKALEALQDRQLLTRCYAQAETMSVGDCFTAARELCRGYLAGEYAQVQIVYTRFISALSQVPTTLTVLPLQPGTQSASGGELLYEPDPQTVLETIVPEYVGGILYGALCESRAAEQAARRNAMDAATQNADDMIEALQLQYNQARQAAITQEITEIIAGV